MNKNVTILIPTYNHGSVLPYQIESLLHQTVPPERIVILDDGSTDDTHVVLNRYAGKKGIEVVRQDRNIGIHAGMNILLNHVETEYFAFAAADDVLTAVWCEVNATLLEKYRSAKMAISNSFISEDGRFCVTNLIRDLNGRGEGAYTPGEYIASYLKSGKLPPSNTIMYRTDIIEELVRPIISRKDLSSLTDVLLMLAIATRYPVAYSTQPTGVFFRSRESYGSAFYSAAHLKEMIAKVERFSSVEGYIQNSDVVRTLKGFLEYI